MTFFKGNATLKMDSSCSGTWQETDTVQQQYATKGFASTCTQTEANLFRVQLPKLV